MWQAVTCICLARLLMKMGPFYISHCTGQYVNDKLQAWKQKRQNQPKEWGRSLLCNELLIRSAWQESEMIKNACLESEMMYVHGWNQR